MQATAVAAKLNSWEPFRTRLALETFDPTGGHASPRFRWRPRPCQGLAGLTTFVG
jgi:hypothetical protein